MTGSRIVTDIDRRKKYGIYLHYKFSLILNNFKDYFTFIFLSYLKI